MPPFVFYLNDRIVQLTDPPIKLNLLQWLRGHAGLTGSKWGCGEGGCGACTVLVMRECLQPVNACLTPFGSVYGCQVWTVEGLAGCSEVPKAMAAGNASQCGYCTPGIVMSMATIKDIEELDGNLCRCTGYRPIAEVLEKRIANFVPKPCDPLPTPQGTLCWTDGNVTWHHPFTVEQLKQLYESMTDARLVHGATEVWVEKRLRGAAASIPAHLIYTGSIKDLDQVTIGPDELVIGAGVSLNRLRTVIEDLLKWRPELKALGMIVEALRWFAGKQVRSMASWAGNLATASPISDLNPCWIVLDAKVSTTKQERIPIRTFITGYRQTVLTKGEVLLSLHIPFNVLGWDGVFHKQSKRLHDDIALVNAAWMFRRQGDVILNARVALGGVGSVTRLLELPSPFTISEAPAIAKWLMEQIKMPASAPGAMVAYRMTLVGSFLLKAIYPTAPELPKVTYQSEKENAPGHLAALHHATGQAIYVDDMAPVKGELVVVPLLSTRANAKVHLEGVDTALKMPGIHAWIDGANVPGCKRFGPLRKDEDLFALTEQKGKVECAGQLMGLLVGVDEETVREALALIKARYEPLGPPILTIEQAIEAGSFFEFERKLERSPAIEEGEWVWVGGEVRIDGQEHFYLECNAVRVEPMDDPCHRLKIWCSSQNPAEVQQWAAEACALDLAQVQCQVPRLGGGFGGKETRSQMLSTAVAVAAYSLGKPCRCALQRSEDMAMTGQRHPFLAKYRVAFNKQDGLLREQHVELWSNGGHSLDLSLGVLERALAHLDNCYHCPRVSYRGRVCRTHLPSNTAFRGFGGPQGMFVMEQIMEHGAVALGIDPARLRQLNLYQAGQITPFAMSVGDAPIQRLWSQLERKYQKLKEDAESFNADNCWAKRGVAMIPTKFGIAFGARHLNQAGALVNIYKDGSVLIQHGGVEMGQGLNVKLAQLAADTLGIPLELVRVAHTHTQVVPNASPTAASASTDLYGQAVVDACNQLKSRLVHNTGGQNTEVHWKEAIRKAYFERVNLSAQGFYATPMVGWDWAEQKPLEEGGSLFRYFTWGVGLSSVQLDCLTGAMRILTTDLTMDLGTPINEAIDRGQVEGAWMQGVGLFCMEQSWWSPHTGQLLTNGPAGYKIPTMAELPCMEPISTTITGNPANGLAIGGSRAVGEPPLFLAAAVHAALRQAIAAARSNDDFFPLNSPATPERCRMAIDDDLSVYASDLVFQDDDGMRWGIPI